MVNKKLNGIVYTPIWIVELKIIKKILKEKRLLTLHAVMVLFYQLH